MPEARRVVPSTELPQRLKEVFNAGMRNSASLAKALFPMIPNARAEKSRTRKFEDIFERELERQFDCLLSSSVFSSRMDNNI
jgi:hypothetical protein